MSDKAIPCKTCGKPAKKITVKEMDLHSGHSTMIEYESSDCDACGVFRIKKP